MNSIHEDKKLFQTFKEIQSIDKQLGEYENTHAPLLTVEKRSELEAERGKLTETFHDLLIEADRIEIRTSPAGKDHANLQRIMLSVFFDLNEMWDVYYQKILDYHTDNELLNRGQFLENYYSLVPPYVRLGVDIPKGIKSIYHESRWSYVYGQYSAAISLSRTVIETILKDKFNIEGNLKEIIKIAKQKGFISKQSAWNADKVRVFANRVLHEAQPSTEKEAKNALDHVLNFIEEIYLEKP